MEDRRTAIAIFICIIIVMVYTEMFIAPMTRPAPVRSVQSVSQTPAQPTTTQQSSVATLAPSVVNAQSAPQVVATDSSKGVPSPSAIGAAKQTIIETAHYIATITHLGGRFTSFKLKNYKEHLNSETPLDLVKNEAGLPLPLGLYSGALSDAFTKYELKLPEQQALYQKDRYLLSGPQTLVLSLNGTLPNGVSVQKIFKFAGNSYLLGIDALLGQPAPDGTNLGLEWSYFYPGVASQGKYDPTGIVILEPSNKVQRFVASKVDKSLSDPIPANWISFADHYFTATLIGSGQQSARFGHQESLFTTRLSAAPAMGSFILYAGPKDYRMLKTLGFGLERNIDLGWFGFLSYPLLLLIRLFDSIFHNYGLAIILLTLVIKGLFLPLTRTSFESMRAMQDLQPEIAALRERVKDSTQLNQEMMALYKKRGVNPMGGCLPILIQIPVFFGLYSALLSSIELRHAPFALWINDLSSEERLILFGVPVPVMILIMGASMFFQQYTTPAVGDPAQRRMMLFMPIIFTVMFIIFPMPSGLVLYWLVNNIISITQQVYLKRDSRSGPLKATIFASIVIFGFGWLLTLI